MNRTDTPNKRKAMRDIQMAEFSAIETALYLDTHPTDKEALAALGKYCAKKKAAVAAYESEFGPLTFCACSVGDGDTDRSVFKWALTPMPWETDDC